MCRLNRGFDAVKADPFTLNGAIGANHHAGGSKAVNSGINFGTDSLVVSVEDISPVVQSAEDGALKQLFAFSQADPIILHRPVHNRARIIPEPVQCRFEAVFRFAADMKNIEFSASLFCSSSIMSVSSYRNTEMSLLLSIS